MPSRVNWDAAHARRRQEKIAREITPKLDSAVTCSVAQKQGATQMEVAEKRRKKRMRRARIARRARRMAVMSMERLRRIGDFDSEPRVKGVIESAGDPDYNVKELPDTIIGE